MPVVRDPEGAEPAALGAHAGLAGAVVLEIGVGEGRLLWRYARVVGAEPDPIRLAQARRDCPPALASRVRLVRAAAEALPFADGAFDRVLLGWSL